jgi:hypothetical protein
MGDKSEEISEFADIQLAVVVPVRHRKLGFEEVQ